MMHNSFTLSSDDRYPIVGRYIQVLLSTKLQSLQIMIKCLNPFWEYYHDVRKMGGIPYTAHGAQITPYPYFSFFFFLFLRLF